MATTAPEADLRIEYRRLRGAWWSWVPEEAVLYLERDLEPVQLVEALSLAAADILSTRSISPREARGLPMSEILRAFAAPGTRRPARAPGQRRPPE